MCVSAPAPVCVPGAVSLAPLFFPAHLFVLYHSNLFVFILLYYYYYLDA